MKKRNLCVVVIFLAGITAVAEKSDAANHPKSLRIHGPIFRNQAAAQTNWTVPALCRAYQFPTGLTGRGVIGIAEFGGGYTTSDLQAFSARYMNGTPINISDVSVDGTTNSPGSPDDGEVTLDIEIAAAAYYYCTGNAPTIKMFFAGKNDVTYNDVINSYSQVVTAAAAAGCDVLSISWASPENTAYRTAAMNLETAVAAASSRGMITFAASGDWDATCEGIGETDGLNHVVLPSSAPHVIAVGGTTKTSTSEVVWNNHFLLGSTATGTGGGYSILFPTQTWQIGAPAAPVNNHGAGRLVPDVAANADPFTGYDIVLGGQVQAVGGTSASTPLWAGLFASFGKKLGFIAPKLWLPSNRSAFKDITSGNNKASNSAVGFTAVAGPDACTGVGAPIGTALATIFVPPPPTPLPIPSNVTATYAAGTLTLKGDANANSLTVSVQAGALKVEGANATKINNSTSFASPLAGSLKVNADLGSGDDSIAFVGVGASSAELLLGAGNDQASFTLCNITNLTIDGGPGTDLLFTISSVIANVIKANFP